MFLAFARTGLCAIVLASGLGTAANATTFTTILSGANERPMPLVTPASGTGSLFLAADQNSFSINIVFTGLSANASMAHIHCCSGPETNSSVAIGFAPPAATSGTILGTFNLTQQSTYSSGFFNGAGGGTVAGARTAFLNGLSSGNAYFNVHNSVFPGGEIRGQLAPAVPEPASWAMLISGFGLTGAAMRRRRFAQRDEGLVGTRNDAGQRVSHPVG